MREGKPMTKKGILRASDVHRDWQRAITDASSSVRIFTPYFDQLLPRLLARARKRGLLVSVVTDLTPTGGQDYPAQLKAARRLIQLGVPLRSLTRLHAKVLQADCQTIVLGSQNFTTFARSSKETSAVPTPSSLEAEFIAQLDQWFAAAEPVDGTLLDLLASDLIEPAKALRDQEKRVHSKYEEVIERDRLRRSALSMQNRLRTASSTSNLALAQGPAVGKVTRTQTIKTFLILNHSDLTQWKVDGEVSRLPHLQQIPIIREDTGRMAFARLAKSRISYTKTNAEWTTRSEIIGGKNYLVSIDLPKEDCTTCNVTATFRIAGVGRLAAADFLFLGDEFRLVHLRHVARHDPTQTDLDRLGVFESHFADIETRLEFFSKYMKNFVYSYLGRDFPNAQSYFGTGRHRITVLRLHGTPVLLATPLE